MLVSIDDIQIKKRVRRDLGDLDSLMDSLRTYGLLNPISITRDYELIAGERRLQAAKRLGWTNINANIIDNMSEVEKLEMELEENNQRKDFTREELMDGYERLEKLRNPSIWTRILNAIKAFFKKIASLFRKKKI